MNFLVDVNLPKFFSYFNSENFIHVADINPSMTDKEIWNYALQNDLVILTKDSDFFSKSVLADRRPKVVYFQLGNQTLNELHVYFKLHWVDIVKHLNDSFLIIAKPLLITAIL